ncbi:hypothetical protein [Loktanella sp. M215]|uniref:hypothetical protein n=1 Tax=Loktanella sp. M215 TaxID=2675431 RepID=UPI001F48B079|nr:hypothetical protein [Loktanella sp. M215]MCF7700982.1 hypothetical protein [Loktanella sp. M215]
MTYQTTPDRRPLRDRLADRIALPPDVLDEEITVLVLFRLSLLLNRATGGAPDMTFSARTAQNCQRGGWRGPLWHLPRIAIDLYCHRYRAEIAHCATALANYHRRRG